MLPIPSYLSSHLVELCALELPGSPQSTNAKSGADDPDAMRLLSDSWKFYQSTATFPCPTCGSLLFYKCSGLRVPARAHTSKKQQIMRQPEPTSVGPRGNRRNLALSRVGKPANNIGDLEVPRTIDYYDTPQRLSDSPLARGEILIQILNLRTPG